MSPPTDSTEIRKADPRARRQVLIALAVLFVLGVVALLMLGLAMADLAVQVDVAPEDAVEGLRTLFHGIAVAIGLGGVATSVYTLLWSRATCREQRFPPERMRVIRDTPVMRSLEALSRGRLAYVLALGLCLSTLWLAR